MFTIGLIVNPIAGMGGRVGLKGTDGPAVQAAIKRGASPLAPARAAEALHELSLAGSTLELLVWRDEMGGHEARAAGFSPVVLAPAVSGPTTAADTHAAAKEMKERGVLLLLFAGGDGTAVDGLRGVGAENTQLGIPARV
jgi:predicted polyphosphate/ATP-dependent NAD kinase